MGQSADIIVIGAGIAGASAAAELANYAKVILLEMEAQPGYHASGRSAAFFAPSYGNKVVQGITATSENFYRTPPEGFSDVSLLQPRDCFLIGHSGQVQQMNSLKFENDKLRIITSEQACQRVPILSPDYVTDVLCDDQGGDLNVDAILQGYLRLFRKRGGELFVANAIMQLKKSAGSWHMHSKNDSFSAPIVVNAAGAWADRIAELANLGAIGITPKRRTAILIDPPQGVDISAWPMVIDIDEEFYFKPDAGQLLISPADETPSEPCDAQAEEIDVAVAVDRFEAATGLDVKRVNHRWAGLRSFAPDKTFVVGFDPRSEGFFWLAGQGGYGVQSAPGMSQLTMSLITGSQLSDQFSKVTNYIDAVSPQRLIKP
jgi:D-arginine dehydrogenase